MPRLTKILVVAATVLFCRAGSPADETPPTLKVPVCVHLVQSSSENSLQTTLTEKDVKRIFGKVNKIWSQAGIELAVESIVQTDANDPPAVKDEQDRWVTRSLPRDKFSASALHVCYVKSLTVNGYFGGGQLIVVKDTAKLRTVPDGIDEPLPRVTSHEIGHALGLPHRQDVVNLMASGTTGFSLNAEEISTARATAAKKFGASKDANR